MRIHHLLQKRAKLGHHRPIASVAKSSRPSDGYHDVSYASLWRAVSNVMHILESSLPTPPDKTHEIKTFAYFGPNDFRQQIIALAAKYSHQVILMTPPCDMVSQIPKLSEAGCCALAAPWAPTEDLKKALSAHGMKYFAIPRLDKLLNDCNCPDELGMRKYQRASKVDKTKSFDVTAWLTLQNFMRPSKEPTNFYGYHSFFDSFERLFPCGNPITTSNNPDQYENVPNWCQLIAGQRFLSAFPHLHVTALQALIWAILLDATVVLPPAGAPLTVELVSEAHKFGNVTLSFLPVSLMQQEFQKHGHVERLKYGRDIKVIGFEASSIYQNDKAI